MKDTNTKLTLICALLLLFGLLGELLNFIGFTRFEMIAHILTAVGGTGGFLMVIWQGSLIRSGRLFVVLQGFLGLIVIGALIKIMHWPFANLFVVTGIVSVPIVYAVHFYRKRSKQRLDMLKLAWVIVAYAANISRLQHWPFSKELVVLELILFLILFADFAYAQYRSETTKR